MIASLYISNRSFLYNGKDTTKQVEEKLLKFKQMIDYVNQYDDNLFFLNPENFLATTLLDKGVTIGDVIKNMKSNLLNRDCLYLFMTLFKKCKKTTEITNQGFLEYLELENKDECNGLLVLNEQVDLPTSIQIISTKEGWLNFRRYYLSKYPINPSYFLAETKKYFDCLRIHSQNANCYLKEILDTHCKRIVAYLSALNDHFIYEYKIFNGDLIHFLPCFATKYGIDDASFEGRKDAKFLCRFKLDDKQVLAVYCEPHLKMFKDDSGNDNQHGRIYFKAPNKEDKIIYIGFICKHL